MKRIQKITLIALAGIMALGSGLWFYRQQQAAGPAAALPASAPPAAAGQIAASLREVLAAHQKIIVLLAEDKVLDAAEQAEANRVGHAIFHENLERLKTLETQLSTLMQSPPGVRESSLGDLLNYIESDAAMFDADRLAFKEPLRLMQSRVAQETTLPAIQLHKRISDDLEVLNEIERAYEKEIKQIFDRFETRGIERKRERWADYLAHLNKRYTREQILKDYGVVMPYPKPPAQKSATEAAGEEIFGSTLPKKTVVLTFDDGPHPRYTNEILAILQQYKVPAIFFNVGKNLGGVNAQGEVKLNRGSEVSRSLREAGYVLANHSFSHAQLSAKTGKALEAEIIDTDKILKAVDQHRAPLFRFPYGARNREGLEILAAAGLKSMMWNIDSLDWADPVPSSIVDRVMRSLQKEGRGIVLFHDIHERTVKALPAVLDKLITEGYQFAAWDGAGFKVDKQVVSPVSVPVSTGYANSWAIVIGIDEYTKWPRLNYAARDAEGVRQALVEKFGFANERVFTLKNGEATRRGILSLFHDKLAHGGMQKDDRLFVFFAGHGATRTLSSGRQLGYIVPVDSDPGQLATDAIPMTELQNIAESITAKHVFFVMDACYSGLGLTRGGGGNAFLRTNAKRIGRQMLTAGGADQLVADGGPNGHSVFTWALLQGLGGKGDLNGDGLITATELAAYVAPAVANASQQTPAFGSLPGSEGGDFVFELAAESEFLSTQTAQLPGEVIALHKKFDDARPAEPAGVRMLSGSAPVTVTIKNLAGEDQKVTTPAAAPLSNRQLAQRANDRGLRLYKEKQYAEAEAQFTEALKLRPDFALAANNLGFVYYRQDKFQEAARWFENTIKLDPSRVVAYLNLGDAYAKLKQNDKSRQAYQTYLSLAPNGPSAAYVKQQLEGL
jgi:peptidoglycan/xylan/chitin deacetylase (PgdA/CDA1 family)/uncharacterized caspase-like protein